MPEHLPTEPAEPRRSAVIQCVRISQLQSVLRSIEVELASPDLTEAQKNNFRNSLAGSCVECGIKIAGTELMKLRRPTAEDCTANPKLARLAKEYCARKGCLSYYYEIELVSDFELPMELAQRLLSSTHCAIPQTAPANPRDQRGWLSILLTRYSSRQTYLALVLVSILLVLVYHKFRTPPWSVRPSDLQVEPRTTIRHIFTEEK